MNHAFEVTDEQYQAIVEAARERGQEPEEFFRSWVNAVQHRVRHEDTDEDQAWFWTPEWQEGEARADADLASGRFTHFDSDEAFLAALDEWDTHAEG